MQKCIGKLFNAVTDAVEILQKVQLRTEEMYMVDENPVIQLLNLEPEKPDADAPPENAP